MVVKCLQGCVCVIMLFVMLMNSHVGRLFWCGHGKPVSWSGTWTNPKSVFQRHSRNNGRWSQFSIILQLLHNYSWLYFMTFSELLYFFGSCESSFCAYFNSGCIVSQMKLFEIEIVQVSDIYWNLITSLSVGQSDHIYVALYVRNGSQLHALNGSC